MRFCVICLSWLAALLCARSRGEDLTAIAQSPYAIQAYVQEHKTLNPSELWKVLGVPEALSDPAMPMFSGVDAFDCQVGSPCEVTVQELYLKADRTRFAALRFTQPRSVFNRYLIFESTGSAWVLEGHIDSTFAKYFDPVLFTREVGGKWWLVLTEQSGSGTGFYSSIQRWFEVQDGLLREVLSILDHAYILGYPGEFVLRPSAVVTGFESSAAGQQFRVSYRTAFTLVNDDGVDRAFFGSIEKSVVYERTGARVAFSLRHFAGSEVELIEPVRLLQSPNLATWFLRHDLANLLKIAKGPRTTEREWLRQTLKEFPPGPERNEIIRALAP